MSPYALGLIFVPSGNEAVLSGNRKALGSCNSCRWLGSGKAVSCCAFWVCALFLDSYFNDQRTERPSVSQLTYGSDAFPRPRLRVRHYTRCLAALFASLAKARMQLDYDTL